MRIKLLSLLTVLVLGAGPNLWAQNAGGLPATVADLQETAASLQTQINNLTAQIATLNSTIAAVPFAPGYNIRTRDESLGHQRSTVAKLSEVPRNLT